MKQQKFFTYYLYFLRQPLVRSAQPNTRFAFVRLHRACYLPH